MAIVDVTKFLPENHIYHGDSRTFLKRIRPESITQTRVFLVGGLIETAANEAGFHLYDRRVWVKDAAWENSKWHTISYRSVDEFEYVYIFWKPGTTKVDRFRLTKQEWVNWGSRAVWEIPSV